MTRITDERDTLRVQLGASDSFHTTDPWDHLPGVFLADHYVHRLSHSGAPVELITATPWTNPLLAADVNRDNAVTALDALIVINRLNRASSPDLPRPTAGDAISFYYDVTRDHTVTPLDALRVINHLNRQQRSKAAEAEATHGAGHRATASALVWPADDDELRRKAREFLR